MIVNYTDSHDNTWTWLGLRTGLTLTWLMTLSHTEGCSCSWISHLEIVTHILMCLCVYANIVETVGWDNSQLVWHLSPISMMLMLTVNKNKQTNLKFHEDFYQYFTDLYVNFLFWILSELCSCSASLDRPLLFPTLLHHDSDSTKLSLLGMV